MKNRLIAFVTLSLFAMLSVTVASAKSGRVISLDKAAFLEKVVDYENNPNEWKYLGEKPAVIDFYADWCLPCRRFAPVLEEIAEEYEGQVIFYKVDVDAQEELAAAFGVSSVPTSIIIPTEGNPHKLEGAYPKEDYKKIIEELLGVKK